jgi:hypothetical protein
VAAGKRKRDGENRNAGVALSGARRAGEWSGVRGRLELEAAGK